MTSSAWKALAASACCAGLAAALLLALAPDPVPDGGRHLAVFRQDRSVRLDSNNLVDLLAGAEFGQKIRRVRWSGAVLSVDFTVAGGGSAEDVYADLKELIALAFGHTSNVRRLLVRFGEDDPVSGRERLLLAADVRRSDPWIAEDWSGLKDAEPDDRIWRERLRIVTTRIWEVRFGR
jgi:hypothetical protein